MQNPTKEDLKYCNRLIILLKAKKKTVHNKQSLHSWHRPLLPQESNVEVSLNINKVGNKTVFGEMFARENEPTERSLPGSTATCPRLRSRGHLI